MSLGEQIAFTFIDYSTAFDKVSHEFLDDTLAEARAPVKVRAMFRAVYAAATSYTIVPVPAPDGKSVKSDVFHIKRGVVQGDITSPLYLILVLQLIIGRHDTLAVKGVSFANTILHTLGYADDIALIDNGHNDSIHLATERVTSIAQGSKKDTDRYDATISIPKTKVLHVRSQSQVNKTTCTEASKVCNASFELWTSLLQEVRIPNSCG